MWVAQRHFILRYAHEVWQDADQTISCIQVGAPENDKSGGSSKSAFFCCVWEGQEMHKNNNFIYSGTRNDRRRGVGIKFGLVEFWASKSRFFGIQMKYKYVLMSDFYFICKYKQALLLNPSFRYSFQRIGLVKLDWICGPFLLFFLVDSLLLVTFLFHKPFRAPDFHSSLIESQSLK